MTGYIGTITRRNSVTPMQVNVEAGMHFGHTQRRVQQTNVQQGRPSGKSLVVMQPTFSIFAGTLMALVMAVNPATLGVEDVKRDTPVVPKTVVSSTMRFAFVVGVEGTGHHSVAQALDHMFTTNQDLVQIAGKNDDVVGDLYTVNFSMGQTAQHYSATLRRARKKMRNLAQRAATLQFPGTVAFTLGSHHLHSYPSGIGPNKALKYLDLRLLAEVAEEEGVDLRVLYLRRHAKDLIIANTIHRDFQE